MSFATFHDKHCSFSTAKPHSYVLTVYSNSVYEGVYKFFIFLQIFWYHPCPLGDWFFLLSAKFVPFLSMWLSGIMTIMNSRYDTASPRKISLWIFISAKLLPPAVSSTVQVFMVFSIKIMTSCDILYILRQCSIPLCGTISYAFF